MENILNPLLKWAGGKRWLVPVLKDIWKPYCNLPYVEPFSGGLAIALGLNPNSAHLNDSNIHLINFYQQVQKGLKINLSFENNSEYYYAMRSQFNSIILNKKSNTKKTASIFYYLIRTGYNGLCRFNKKGEFNVPFGTHKTINYKTDFLGYRNLFKNWHFSSVDFENLILNGDEFLYVDPPYDVEFTQYQPAGFNWDDQLRLVDWLMQHQGPIVASNQATTRIIKLYKKLKFTVFIIDAPRTIACNGNRNPAQEMLALKGFNMKMISTLYKGLR